MRRHTVETAPTGRQRPRESRSVAASALVLVLALGTLDPHTAAAGEARNRETTPSSALGTDLVGGSRVRLNGRRASPHTRVLPGVDIAWKGEANKSSDMLRVFRGSPTRAPHDARFLAAIEIGELQRAAEGLGRAYEGHRFSARHVESLLSVMEPIDTMIREETSVTGHVVDTEREAIHARLVGGWIEGQLSHALASPNAQQGGPESYYWRTGAPIAAGNMLDRLFRSLWSQDSLSEILVAPAVVRAVRAVVDALKFNPLVRAPRGLDPSDAPTDFGVFVLKHEADSPWKVVVDEAAQHRATPALEPTTRW